MKHIFYVNQRTNDFIPIRATISVEDNTDWDSDMIESFKQDIAELYDCSLNEVTAVAGSGNKNSNDK